MSAALCARVSIMTLSLDEADLWSIARGGATLYERAQSKTGSRDSPLNRSRLLGGSLNRWKDFSALGDEEGFNRRLSWEGWSPDVARSLLQRSSRPAGDSLPGWAKELDSIMEEAERVCSELSPRWFLRREPSFLDRNRVAFEELLAPFVLVATRRLDDRLESERDRLSPGAFAVLQRELLTFCCLYGGRVLYREFSRFREQQGGSRRSAWQTQGPEPRWVYRRFVRSMLRGAFPDLMRAYPVLGRNLAVSIGTWVDWIEEFLIRLDRDWPRLVRSFAGGTDPGRVVDVLADQSDRHCGGRSIIICRFESGKKFVYKPRSIEADVRFYDLLEWLGDRSEISDFKRPRTIERPLYGWREYVPATPCDGPEAAGRFYRRTGVLVFLMYLLQGDDAHCENLVASGEYPLLVDLESILSPPIDTPPDSRRGPARMRARAHLKETVLRTGFLPRQFPHPEGGVYDATGLGGRNGEVTDHVRPSWVRVNTDSMEMQTSYHVIDGLENLPTGPDGVLFEPRDHLEELVEGFKAAYRFFSQRCDRILGDETHPLTKMKSLSGRYLPRGTTEYSRLIFSGSSPEYMRDGAKRSLIYDALARSLLWSNHFLDEPDLLPFEHRAMDRLDIPLFYAPAEGTELRIPGTNGHGEHPEPGDSIANFFEQSGFERMRECLRGLNEEDLAYQVSIIRTGFFARRRSHSPRPVKIRDPSSDPESRADQPGKTMDFQGAALQVGRWIIDRARMIRGDRDRSASWIAVEPDMRHEDYELQPLGFSCFSGTSGIALFLGRLARCTGEDTFFRGAKQALGEVDSFSRRRLRRLCEYRPAGGIAGVVSAAYPLALMGEEWQRPEWIDRARWMAEQIPEPSLIGNSASADTVTGMAGTALVLSAVHKRAPSPEIKQRLETLGEALIERTASRTSVAEENQMAQGFSRGRAGIATALFRLARVTGTDRFREAAEASLSAIRDALNQQLDSNEVPGRKGSNPSRSVHLSWCQGLAGMALPFLEARQTSPSEPQEDILDRMAGFLSTVPGETEHGTLCCGVGGRALVLAEIGSSLDHLRYRRKARSLAARMVARERKGSGYDGIAEPPGTIPNPGLFQGWAGLGMLLLSGIEGEAEAGGILRCL